MDIIATKKKELELLIKNLDEVQIDKLLKLAKEEIKKNTVLSDLKGIWSDHSASLKNLEDDLKDV